MPKRKEDEEKRKAKWGALGGGLTGAVTGAGAGAYAASLHPETVGAYTSEMMHEGLGRAMESMGEQMGEGWKPKGYGKTPAFGKGEFGPHEAAARARALERKALNRRALRRLGKYTAIGAGSLGAIGAATGYAHARAGTQQKHLSSFLDDLLEFEDLKEKAKSKFEEIKNKFKKKKGHRSHAGGLSALLDNLIEFRRKDEAPEIQSWNPVTRYKEHKALQHWVETRPPSAGITAEALQKKYPRQVKEEQAVKKGLTIGAASGAVPGAVIGALKAPREVHFPGHGVASEFTPIFRKAGSVSKLRGLGTPIIHGPGTKGRLIAGGIGAALGAYGGAVVGSTIAEAPYAEKRMQRWERAHKKLMQHMKGEHAVPAETLKSKFAPRATSYGEVAGELKKQKVGFVQRHATAAATRPFVWSGSNAAFVNAGEKGVIVTSKKVHPAVFRHEAGHAEDYAYYGGEKGFHKAYPHYGNPFTSYEHRISSTLLPEERAWKYAKTRSKRDKEIQKAALATYRSGMGLSALLTELIEFQGDPRPRNRLGEFSGEEGGPDPNAMEKTYRTGLHRGILEGAGTAIAGGAGGALSSAAVKGLLAKAKAARKGKPKLIVPK